MGIGISDGVLLGAAVYGGVILAVFWLALVLWTWPAKVTPAKKGPKKSVFEPATKAAASKKASPAAKPAAL